MSTQQSFNISKASELIPNKDYVFVYKTTNLINNKIYVGKHIQHETSAFDGYLGSGTLIVRAINKYKKEKFTREILEFCTSEIINEREMFWIHSLNSMDINKGYNLSKGGEGSLGYKFPDEIKQKMSKSRMGEKHPMYGKHQSEESKKKNRESQLGEKSAWYGRRHTEEEKIKISEGNKGRIFSEDSKRKIGNSNRGKIRSEDFKKNISKTLTGKYVGDLCPNTKYDYILSNNEIYSQFFNRLDRQKILCWFSRLKTNIITYKNIIITRKLKEFKMGDDI